MIILFSQEQVRNHDGKFTSMSYKYKPYKSLFIKMIVFITIWILRPSCSNILSILNWTRLILPWSTVISIFHRYFSSKNYSNPLKKNIVIVNGDYERLIDWKRLDSSLIDLWMKWITRDIDEQQHGLLIFDSRLYRQMDTALGVEDNFSRLPQKEMEVWKY